MKTWDEMTEIEKIKAQYSDLHKDVYGFRPKNYEEMAQWSDEKWEAEYDRLLNLPWDEESC